MTKEEIIEKVKNNMKIIGWLDYDKEIGIECWNKEEIEDREYKKREIYRVFFYFPDEPMFTEEGKPNGAIEGYYCSCYVDATTYEILYYSRPHGYIEPDGTY
jgi:hypothetical protein